MNKTVLIYSKTEASQMVPRDRPICFRVTSKIYHAAFEAAGYASLCWEPKPTGVFDSDKASKTTLDLLFVIAEEMERLGITFDQVNAPKPEHE